MDKLATDFTAIIITVIGMLIVVSAVFPGARRFAGRLFIGYVAIPAVIGAVFLYALSSISMAVTGMPVPSWWIFVVIFLLAPLVTAVLGLQLLTGIVRLLFGERAAGHVAAVLTLRTIDRISGRRHGRPIPPTEDPVED